MTRLKVRRIRGCTGEFYARYLKKNNFLFHVGNINYASGPSHIPFPPPLINC